MPLTVGQTLSSYEVLGALGAGAMGEVYRARDTRLGREVAIKVLPEHFAAEPERLARFEREARSLASLNHPNIAQIHGVDQVDDTCFLVLELVPGESLDERLRRGRMPLDEALDVCRQIAEGLETAHEAGVIHRDLKPANVRVTPDGKVKLLDFGLAKSTGEAGDGTSSLDSVLTTEAGRLLGTPTYMAPEQARGKPIDRRVDIWAFGCVLYECLTGARAFDGETLSDVLGSVLHEEPDPTRLPADTPPRVRELLADCLVKDPRSRVRDAGDVRRALERARTDPGGPATPAPASRGRSRERVAWATAALLALVALVLALRPDPVPAVEPTIRASLVLPEDFELARVDRPLALSPDGRRLALVGSLGDERRRLWVRPLDGAVPQPLAGSEGADYPFWSPDGNELGFFADGGLKRMPASGGSVTTICAAQSLRGASWGVRGDIVFTPAAFGPLHRVPASGGTPTPLTEAEGEESHRLPCFLPDGRRVLYSCSNAEDEGIFVLDLDSGERRRILDVTSDARYVEPGLLVYVRAPALVVQSFDLETLTLSGEPRVVVEDVEFNPYRLTGSYSTSVDGQLVFEPVARLRQLQWFDGDGRPGGLLGRPERYEEVGLSLDGRRVAATLDVDGVGRDLWVLDAQRGLGTKVAEGDAREPLVRDDVVMFSRREQEGEREFRTYLRAIDGSSPDREYAGGWCSDLSRDGQWILLSRQVGGTGFDVLAVRADGTGEPRVLAGTTANELQARFSPDGRWIVFMSDAPGPRELFLQPFPGPGSPQQLTGSGVGFGAVLAWLEDGRMIYRDAGDLRLLWSLSVDTSGPRPEIGTPEPFAGGLPVADGPTAVDPDGTRVLVAVPVDRGDRRFVSLVRNGLRPAVAERR